MFFITLAIVLSWQNICFAGHKIKLGLMTLRQQDDAFFSLLVDFTRAACENLDMDLYAIYGNDSISYITENLHSILDKNKIDAMIILNYQDKIDEIAEKLEANRVPFFVYNSGFSSSNKTDIKNKYKYFLGEMLPTDEYAGYSLGKTLIENSLPNSKGEFHLISLAGGVADEASIKRIAGLNKFIKQSKKKIIIDKIFYINWRKEEATKVMKNEVSIMNNLSAIWAASDSLALGAVESISKQNSKILVGGIDWSFEGVKAVSENKLFATVGGHFMDGAWISVLLHDYFHGIDIFDENKNFLNSWMSLIRKNNSDKYLNFFNNRKNWKKIDFKKLSKVYNSRLKNYDFSEKRIVPLIFANE
ncbi:substrate-binding domain-containing protein [Pigmentibacter sp. JX0631]|uniref:substrate-binding domain-containing protein n=1 Tax=Pigmentibacter sp. JX0631 TaxID=2976982 RepID=UPI0024696A87|nr:substrate-binding domain-containing protein [Pigmentibacter sp. JX0631]WGL59706.1 substrate-binding domain-containing protein [Pigmentibacter sp. JX0631]